MQERIREAVETLEALYFLLKSYGVHQERLKKIRELASILNKSDRLMLIQELADEIQSIRTQAGAMASDSDYRSLLANAKQYRGRSYLSKLFIDASLFSHYEKVFPRWPDIKPHALVVFDGQTMEDLRNILEMESELFRDIQVLLSHAKDAHQNVEDFRKRKDKDQKILQSYLRSAITSLFRFIEAYLNGLAYDCFQIHHDRLSVEDHDFLAEWDTITRRTKYVAFSDKVLRYPAVIANTEEKSVDLTKCKAADVLSNQGRIVRDSLTHPSQYLNPKTGFQEKLLFVTGVNLPLALELFQCAMDYVSFVEHSLGRDPAKSVPWLFK